MKKTHTKRNTKVWTVLTLVLAGIVALSLSGCSDSEPDYVSQQVEPAPAMQELTQEEIDAFQADNIYLPDNIVPRSPAVSGGPENPPISAQRAAELAREHLISEGITEARFDYIYMDREHGTWVWSVEFDGVGVSYEFYIDLQAGTIVDFVIDR